VRRDHVPDHVGDRLADQHDGHVLARRELAERLLDLLCGGARVDDEKVAALAQVDVAHAREEEARDGVLVGDDGEEGAVLLVDSRGRGHLSLSTGFWGVGRRRETRGARRRSGRAVGRSTSTAAAGGRKRLSLGAAAAAGRARARTERDRLARTLAGAAGERGTRAFFRVERVSVLADGTFGARALVGDVWLPSVRKMYVTAMWECGELWLMLVEGRGVSFFKRRALST
jgi:hypothetical protein